MAKSKATVRKNCTGCGLQVAVACKTCPGCKNIFYSAKKTFLATLTANANTDNIVSRRRTERVKREKPNYYDASEYEKKTRKKRLERGQYVRDGRGRPPNSATLKRKKRKTKVAKEAEEDSIPVLSPEKTVQCSIILAELNRKFFSSTWKV